MSPFPAVFPAPSPASAEELLGDLDAPGLRALVLPRGRDAADGAEPWDWRNGERMGWEAGEGPWFVKDQDPMVC